MEIGGEAVSEWIMEFCLHVRCEIVPALFEGFEEGRMPFFDMFVQRGVIAGDLCEVDE